LARS
jgi:hypothetical protein